jgi:zinc transport system substrate-binding protein
MNAAAVLLLAVALLVPSGARAESLRVLASFFPMYLFSKNVVGDTSGVTVDAMLPPSLGCPHDYALTPGDMKKIAAADIFIANGLGMEEFLGTPVRQANPGIVMVETAAFVTPDRILATREGSDPGRPPGEDHDHGDVNPHTWTSPRNAILQVRGIEEALSEASPRNAAAFRRNAGAYVARLEALAREYEDASLQLRGRAVVTYHDVLDYLMRDAGLTVVGHIMEVAGEEPSAGDIQRLIRTIRETKAAAVFAEPQYATRLAETVGREAGVPVRILDPVAMGDPSPTAYEDAMRENLYTILTVLGAP